MKSKVVIVLILAVILLAGGGVFYLITSRNEKEPASPLGEASEGETAFGGPQTPPAPSVLVWNDQAGFTFQYPSELKINPHEEDQVNYANMDLTVEGKVGGIKVLAQDSKYKTNADWLKNDKSIQGGSAIDAPLGAIMSKKVLFDASGRIVIGTIDDAILFTIELTPDEEGYWQGVFDQIVSSFAFVTPTPAQPVPAKSSGSSGGQGDIIEEEEIVE